MLAATYSMPPAVTTMPMKMKNEWMGTEGGWTDRTASRAGGKYGRSRIGYGIGRGIGPWSTVAPL